MDKHPGCCYCRAIQSKFFGSRRPVDASLGRAVLGAHDTIEVLHLCSGRHQAAFPASLAFIGKLIYNWH